MLVYIFLFSLNFSFSMTEEELKASILNHFPLIEEAELKKSAAAEEIRSTKGAFDHKFILKSRHQIEDKYDNSYFEAIINKQTPYKGLNLFAGHRQGNGTFAAYDGKYNTSSVGEIFAGLSFPLLRNFSTDLFRTELEASELKKQIAAAEIELKKFIYVHKGFSTLYKWLYTRKKVSIRENVLNIAVERQTMLEKKFKAGDIEELKLEDNKRSIDKRKVELAQAKIELEEAKNLLSLYYRDHEGVPKLPNDENLVLDESLLPFNYNEAIKLPQEIILDKEIEFLNSYQNFWRQSKLPGLNFEILGARDIGSNTPYDADRLQVGIKFDLPLENRKATGKSSAHEYKIRSLMKQREYLKQDIKQFMDYSVRAIKITSESWSYITSELNRTLQIEKAERLKFMQGSSDLYIVALREQDSAEANIKRWKVWFEYHLHQLDARLFSGTILK